MGKWDMTGALFRNEDATPGQSAYNGSAEICDIEYWLNGDVQKDEKGKSFYALEFVAKESKETAGKGTVRRNGDKFSGEVSLMGCVYKITGRIAVAGEKSKRPGMKYFKFTFKDTGDVPPPDDDIPF